MAFTQADVDTLKRAIATGALRVRYPDGREVQYRSLVELKAVLAMAQTDASGTPSRGHSVAGF